MKVNSKVFNFQLFLSNKKQITDLESSARSYGGATKNLITGKAWSNIEGNEYITVNKKENTLSIFIPDTMHDKTIDNTKYINYIINSIYNNYNTKQVTAENAIGSWYSDALDQVIYDNITIVTVILQNIKITDIMYFIELASYIKTEMQQEGVSIGINESLAII